MPAAASGSTRPHLAWTQGLHLSRTECGRKVKFSMLAAIELCHLRPSASAPCVLWPPTCAAGRGVCSGRERRQQSAAPHHLWLCTQSAPGRSRRTLMNAPRPLETHLVSIGAQFRHESIVYGGIRGEGVM
jgi:hypothetical protein